MRYSRTFTDTQLRSQTFTKQVRIFSMIYPHFFFPRRSKRGRQVNRREGREEREGEGEEEEEEQE